MDTAKSSAAVGRSPAIAALVGAVVTAVTLIGGLFAGGLIGFLVFESLPGHSTVAPDAVQIALAAAPAFAGFLIGSAAWGVCMGWLGGSRDRRRMAVAGMLGFAPITLAVGIGLSVVEPVAVEVAGALPVHRVFTLLFVGSAFLVAGVSAWSVTVGLGRPGLRVRVLRDVGLAGAGGFLAVNLFMETMGWVVGGPGAAARTTMLTVLLLGTVGASLAGGAVLGWTVNRSRRA